MMETPIVITGVGVVSSIGAGRAAYWEALASGAHGFRAFDDFAAEPYPCGFGARVPSLTDLPFPKSKQLWASNRAIRFGVAAATMALADAGLNHRDDAVRGRIGVVFGSTLSCLEFQVRLDHMAAVQGPQSVDPVIFPDASVGAPACRTAMVLGLLAPNATLSNGSTSALDSIAYGAMLLHSGDADVILAGGVEELGRESYMSHAAAGELVADEPVCRPFDRQRHGTLPGEGAAVLVLERAGHAQARGARAWATLGGYGTAFDGSADRADGASVSERAIDAALNAARVAASDIDVIFAGASGSVAQDRLEARALGRVFRASTPPRVTAIKSSIGDTYSAAGAMQAAACVLALGNGLVPPTLHHREADPECDGLKPVTEATAAAMRRGLIHIREAGGASAALVLAAPAA